MGPLALSCGAQRFKAPMWSVGSDGLLLARRLRLHGCPKRYQPISHVVTAMPGGPKLALRHQHKWPNLWRRTCGLISGRGG